MIESILLVVEGHQTTQINKTSRATTGVAIAKYAIQFMNRIVESSAGVSLCPVLIGTPVVSIQNALPGIDTRWPCWPFLLRSGDDVPHLDQLPFELTDGIE